MRSMMDEMRLQRDDMKAVSRDLIEMMQRVIITRETVTERIEFRPPEGDFEAVPKLVGHGTGLGHTSPRPKTAADKVREHLAEHPEDRVLPVRDLADKIGVGKSTVQRVLAE